MMATAALQIVIVAVSGSIGLLADTLHNLGHAVTTIPLVIAFKIGQRQASKGYSYGYRRAEDLVGVLISLVIAASVVLIVVESIDALINPRPLANLGWVFAAGIVGALGNEIVAVYRIRTGRKIGSAALIAEGQHARADGLTSIAVVVGVVGVWLGFQRADAIVGLLIAAAIFGILLSSMKSIAQRLMDGIDPKIIDAMTSVAGCRFGRTRGGSGSRPLERAPDRGGCHDPGRAGAERPRRPPDRRAGRARTAAPYAPPGERRDSSPSAGAGESRRGAARTDGSPSQR